LLQGDEGGFRRAHDLLDDAQSVLKKRKEEVKTREKGRYIHNLRCLGDKNSFSRDWEGGKVVTV